MRIFDNLIEMDSYKKEDFLIKLNDLFELELEINVVRPKNINYDGNTIVLDDEFKKLLYELGMECVYISNKSILIFGNKKSYNVDYVNIPNRIDKGYDDDALLLIDTIKKAF